MFYFSNVRIIAASMTAHSNSFKDSVEFSDADSHVVPNSYNFWLRKRQQST